MLISRMDRLRVAAAGFAAALLLGAIATGCAPRAVEPVSTSQPQEPVVTSPAAGVPAGPILSAAPTVTVLPADSEPPTLIFHNGTILTMESEFPTAEAIAVAGNTILAFGTNADILALQGPDTQVIDLQGLTLMPGFIDTHTHILNDASTDPATGNLQRAQELLLKNGITSLGNLYTTEDFLNEMRTLDASGGLRVRTSLYMAYGDPCGKVLGDWYKKYPPTHELGEMLRIAGVKVFSDGGSCGHMAISFDRAVGGRGDLWFTPEQLNKIVADVDTLGYQIAIHAIGDRAVDEALNAIEFALHGRPNVLRHRIEHNTTVRPDSYPRYQQLDVVPTLIGNIWSCKDVFFAKGIVPDPAANRAWNFPYRAMMDASPEAHFAWHSDYPWASPNPLLHLYSLVTPFEIAGDMTECPDPTWAGNKTLTVDEALRMMTIGGAYALFREEEVGSLRPGKFADLIILSGNPTTDLSAVRYIQVWMTMVGGQVEWCAPGHEGLCTTTREPLGDPLPAPVRIRIQFSTTSDWATLALASGGTLTGMQLVSASPEATRADAGAGLGLNQPIQRAESGGSVNMVVDAYVSDAYSNGQLQFVIECGALGSTLVKLYTYPGDSPVEASSTRVEDTVGTFVVTSEGFVPR